MHTLEHRSSRVEKPCGVTCTDEVPGKRSINSRCRPMGDLVGGCCVMRLIRTHDARRRYLPLLPEASQTSKASRNKNRRQRGRFSRRLEGKSVEPSTLSSGLVAVVRCRRGDASDNDRSLSHPFLYSATSTSPDQLQPQLSLQFSFYSPDYRMPDYSLR